MNNQYNSLVSTFVAEDIYNLPLPVLPPADLGLASTLFSPRFFGNRDGTLNEPIVKFRINENPYIRTMGLFANLADGLVNKASRQGWVIKTELRRYATIIQPGTLTIAKGSAIVTGSGTAFASTWVGKPIAFYDDMGVFQTYDVYSVASATSMVLTKVAASAATMQRFTQQDRPLTGTIANVAGNATLTGTGTLFLTELAPGLSVMWLDDSYNVREGVISAIASNTSLTLTAATDNTASSMFSGVATTAANLYILQETSTSTTLQMPALNTLFTRAYPAGDVSHARPVRGLVTISAATAGGANATVTGFGTKFLTDLVVGQSISYIGDNGNKITCIVAAITSDTATTLTTPGAGTAGVALALTKGRLIWTDAFWAVRGQVVMDMAMYTITIDPAFGDGTRRLSFSFVGEMEHNVQLMNRLNNT